MATTTADGRVDLVGLLAVTKGPNNARVPASPGTDATVVSRSRPRTAHIYYKDWGKGPAVAFSHGWPLNADAWEGQTFFLTQNGFRTIAHDRRGHGRSTQASSGNEMDTYADDLAAVIEALDLNEITMVGHSTGGGEVARYIGRHGTGRVAKAVLISAVPPLMLATRGNPEGLPIDVFDNLRAGLTKDRSQFWRDFPVPFFGTNRKGSKVSQGILDDFWLPRTSTQGRGVLK